MLPTAAVSIVKTVYGSNLRSPWLAANNWNGEEFAQQLLRWFHE